MKLLLKVVKVRPLGLACTDGAGRLCGVDKAIGECASVRLKLPSSAGAEPFRGNCGRSVWFNHGRCVVTIEGC